MFVKFHAPLNLYNVYTRSITYVFIREKDEIRDGFVLTCQAHPTSNKVVIDFDAR